MSKAPETLTVEESEALLNSLLTQKQSTWSKWKNQRNYTIALLMLDAGLRVGEVVRLKVSQLLLGGLPVAAIDLTGDAAEKKCERIIPVSNRLPRTLGNTSDLIWSTRPEFQTGYAFFEHDSTKHITARQVERIIKAASMRAFGREIHPHVLRHTFATRLMRVTSTPVVQQLLGHKHLSSTQVYVHPNGDDCKKAIERLAAG